VEPNESGCEREIAEAIRAVRAGDVQAYAAIVERFQGPLMTLCTAMLRDRQAAEELAQDTLVRAYERLDTFDASRPMKPWLFRIAHRLAQQGWRASRREQARRQAAAAAMDRHRGEPGPAEKLLAVERSERLWQAVSRLPMAQRTAVVLYYREDQTVQRVAEAMGISPGTVKTHLLRARSRIQAELTGSPSDAGDLP
jgi:RNA polymerase sigma-70 factor (ECF subfamily)